MELRAIQIHTKNWLNQYVTLKIEKINLNKTALYQQHVFIKDGAY